MFMNGNNRYGNQDDVDSGQGSSLDRDYGLYNNYPKQSNGGSNGAQPNSSSKQDQYYYNLPQNQQNSGAAQPPPARRSEGLDLTNNREYRGSAFELYKKPLSEARQPPTSQLANLKINIIQTNLLPDDNLILCYTTCLIIMCQNLSYIQHYLNLYDLM